LEAVVTGEIEKGPIVDDKPVRILADHGCLHAIVEDLAGRSADRLEGGDMATQNRLEILMDDKAGPD